MDKDTNQGKQANGDQVPHACKQTHASRNWAKFVMQPCHCLTYYQITVSDSAMPAQDTPMAVVSGTWINPWPGKAGWYAISWSRQHPSLACGLVFVEDNHPGHPTPQCTFMNRQKLAGKEFDPWNKAIPPRFSQGKAWHGKSAGPGDRWCSISRNMEDLATS